MNNLRERYRPMPELNEQLSINSWREYTWLDTQDGYVQLAGGWLKVVEQQSRCRVVMRGGNTTSEATFGGFGAFAPSTRFDSITNSLPRSTHQQPGSCT